MLQDAPGAPRGALSACRDASGDALLLDEADALTALVWADAVLPAEPEARDG